MNIKVDVIAPWIFLGISVFLIILVTPFSMLSDKLESFTLDTSVYLYFSNETGNNMKVAIDMMKDATTSIDLSFRTPPNFELYENFQSFQDSLKEASDRGVKIRIYTQNQSYKAPGNIEVKYFPRTDFKFYVNLLIIDGKDVLIPSSILPEYTQSNRRINYYASVRELGTNALVFFEYLWNLPKSGSYSVAKKYWATTRQWTKDRINITLDPVSYFPLNKSSMPSNVRSALTVGSEYKCILSERFFPEHISEDNLDEIEETAYHTTLLEKYYFEDQQTTLYTSFDSFCEKESHFREIQASHPQDIHFDVYIEKTRNYHLLEGTIVATSDRGMFAPVSYDEIFRSNCLFLGFDFKGDKFYRFFSEFIESQKNLQFSHLTFQNTICAGYHNSK